MQKVMLATLANACGCTLRKRLRLLAAELLTFAIPAVVSLLAASLNVDDVGPKKSLGRRSRTTKPSGLISETTVLLALGCLRHMTKGIQQKVG
jgi:hypothetical protein